MSVMWSRAAIAVSIAAASVGCSTSGSATGSFASFVGVLGCADMVAWGTVAASESVPEDLQVTLDVEEWVYPSTGDDSVRLIADDPAKEVAAPPWPVSDETVLVVVSDNAPPARYSENQGQEAVAQRRDAGAPRPPSDESAGA